MQDSLSVELNNLRNYSHSKRGENHKAVQITLNSHIFALPETFAFSLNHVT